MVIDPAQIDSRKRRRQGALSVIGLTIAVVMLGTLAVFTGSVVAQETAAAPAQAVATTPVLKIDTGDTAWVLTSTALVLAMTMPGLALFYGGLVRSKNVLGTIMQSIVILCLVSLLWILVGYSLAFSLALTGYSKVLPNPEFASDSLVVVAEETRDADGEEN